MLHSRETEGRDLIQSAEGADILELSSRGQRVVRKHGGRGKKKKLEGEGCKVVLKV